MAGSWGYRRESTDNLTLESVFLLSAAGGWEGKEGK